MRLVEQLRWWAAECDRTNFGCQARKLLLEAAEALEKAESVKHGRWEHLEQGWFDLWRCTSCGDEWTFEYDPTDADTKVNYCPNCGAMMDGGEVDV